MWKKILAWLAAVLGAIGAIFVITNRSRRNEQSGDNSGVTNYIRREGSRIDAERAEGSRERSRIDRERERLGDENRELDAERSRTDRTDELLDELRLRDQAGEE